MQNMIIAFNIDSIFLFISGFNIEVQFFTCYLFVEFQYIFTCTFKVRLSIIACGHKQLFKSYKNK